MTPQHVGLHRVAVSALVAGTACAAVLPAVTADAATPLPALTATAASTFATAHYTTAVTDPNGTTTPYDLTAVAGLTASGLDLAGAAPARAAADSLDAKVGGGTATTGPTVVSSLPAGGTQAAGPTTYAVPLTADTTGPASAAVSGLQQTATTRPVTDPATDDGSPVATAGTSGGTFDIAPTGNIGDPANPAVAALAHTRAAVAASRGEAVPLAVDAASGQFTAVGSTTTSVSIGGQGTTATATAAATASTVTLVQGLLTLRLDGGSALAATATPDPAADTATWTPPTVSYDLGGTGTFTPVPAGGFSLTADQQAEFNARLTITPGALATTTNGQTVTGKGTAATVTFSVGDPAAPDFTLDATVGALEVTATAPAAVVATPTPTPTPTPTATAPTSAAPTSAAPGTTAPGGSVAGSGAELANTGRDTAGLAWFGAVLAALGSVATVAGRRRRGTPRHHGTTG